MNKKLKSEKVVISAPFSFGGSAKRIWKLTGNDNKYIKWLLLTPVALTLTGGAWIVIFFWYIAMYLVFGIFFFVFRLFRRSSRQNKADKLRHRELLELIKNQKE